MFQTIEQMNRAIAQALSQVMESQKKADQNPADQLPMARPSVVQVPTVRPPVVQVPTVQPPAVQVPAVRPPAAQPQIAQVMAGY